MFVARYKTAADLSVRTAEYARKYILENPAASMVARAGLEYGLQKGDDTLMRSVVMPEVSLLQRETQRKTLEKGGISFDESLARFSARTSLLAHQQIDRSKTYEVILHSFPKAPQINWDSYGYPLFSADSLELNTRSVGDTKEVVFLPTSYGTFVPARFEKVLSTGNLKYAVATMDGQWSEDITLQPVNMWEGFFPLRHFDVLYRADGRPATGMVPSGYGGGLFHNGLQPLNQPPLHTPESLEAHIFRNQGNYVSATTSKGVAENIFHLKRYYTLRNVWGIDLKKDGGLIDIYPDDAEIIMPYRVAPEQIERMTYYDSVADEWIVRENPAFDPEHAL